MSLNETSARVRPFAGRDEAFALAVLKAERAALPPKAPEPSPLDHVARFADGSVLRRNGTAFRPGPMFDAAELAALPLKP